VNCGAEGRTGRNGRLNNWEKGYRIQVGEMLLHDGAEAYKQEGRAQKFMQRRVAKPPVPAHPHCPVPLQVALEWVQGVPWRIHVGRAGGRIQSGEKSSQSVCVFWLNASLRAGFGKLLDAFVPIALKRMYSVPIHDTHG
jgi:hypothetical protein